MLDEEGRRQKAAKIVAVVRHALGVRRRSTGLRAVDVGCSAGFIADELALAGATTSGVDIDEPGLEKARARFGERVDFRLARGEDLPFDDDSSTSPCSTTSTSTSSTPRPSCADILRVLRPGGLLYLGSATGSAGGRAAPPAAVPVLAAARRARRPLHAASPARATTTTSATTPRPGCAGCSPPTTSGTTRCRCSPTRSVRRGDDVVRPGRRRCRPRRSARRCRWCPRTSGRLQDAARPRRAAPGDRPRHL